MKNSRSYLERDTLEREVQKGTKRLQLLSYAWKLNGNIWKYPVFFAPFSKWRILPWKGLFVWGKARVQTSFLQKTEGALTKALRYDEQQLLLKSSRILLELFTNRVTFFLMSDFIVSKRAVCNWSPSWMYTKGGHPPTYLVARSSPLTEILSAHPLI